MTILALVEPAGPLVATGALVGTGMRGPMPETALPPEQPASASNDAIATGTMCCFTGRPL
jgi:hypothetical protein